MLVMKYRQTHSKTHDLRSHFKNKMRLRFGIYLNRFGLRDLHCFFLENSVFVRKESNMKSWYYLKYLSEDIFILYDGSRKEFITAYTTKIMIESSELKGFDFDKTLYI